MQFSTLASAISSHFYCFIISSALGLQLTLAHGVHFPETLLGCLGKLIQCLDLYVQIILGPISVFLHHCIISSCNYSQYNCTVAALRHFVLQQHLIFQNVYVLEACVITFYDWCLISLYLFATYMINNMVLYWSHDFMC